MSIASLPESFDIAREFPIVERWDFFNHAGVAPLCARAAQALRVYAQQAEEDAYIKGRWYKQAEVTRAAAAKLIHATPAEIAFIKNTSEGLAFVANGLEWQAGEEIVSTAVEYPANVYPWMDLAQRLGVKHIMVPEREGRIVIEDLLGAVTARTRMIALSHVEYASGYRNDVAAIGRFCRERGILFCVDAIQSVGVVPVDVEGMSIDFLSADGHKWMLGPEGLGIFYCRKELLSTLRVEVGWMNVVNATDYGNIDFTLRQDARRFECGSYNIPGILSLGAALGLINEVGMECIWGRVRGLTGYLVEGLRGKGYKVVSTRGGQGGVEGGCSGIVSFISGRHDHFAIVKELEAKNIIIVMREGRLRASPHFYNTLEQMDRLLEALPGHS